MAGQKEEGGRGVDGGAVGWDAKATRAEKDCKFRGKGAQAHQNVRNQAGGSS